MVSVKGQKETLSCHGFLYVKSVLLNFLFQGIVCLLGDAQDKDEWLGQYLKRKNFFFSFEMILSWGKVFWGPMKCNIVHILARRALIVSNASVLLLTMRIFELSTQVCVGVYPC